jgi:hypothetical protein
MWTDIETKERGRGGMQPCEPWEVVGPEGGGSNLGQRARSQGQHPWPVHFPVPIPFSAPNELRQFSAETQVVLESGD